jgi:ectoine hydroxylase-related dioxygenase (phytanoyl-CoA dioxygenase family)
LSYHSQLLDAGYAVIPDAVEPSEIDRLLSCIQNLTSPNAGTRRLIDMPWCEALAARIAHDARVRELLPESATAVQCTLFNKSSETNWLVPLHQDLSIPVAERVDSPHCSAWSEKEGEIFVQPPVRVLQKMLAIRLHLDDCNDRNGALRVVAGSHRLGRLNSIDTRRERDQHGDAVIGVPRGGAMLMRPLLLHASSKAIVDIPRRVLHFVFGPGKLPEGLRWRSRSQ